MEYLLFMVVVLEKVFLMNSRHKIIINIFCNTSSSCPTMAPLKYLIPPNHSILPSHTSSSSRVIYQSGSTMDSLRRLLFISLTNR